MVGAIVWVLATIAILRGRRRRTGEPAQTHGDVRIEALWTVIPLVTVLVLFGLTVQTLGKVDAKGTGGVNLHVTAFRWQWQADYADAGVRLVGHRRPAAGGRAARRRDRPRHAGLGRREPRVLRPGVPVQARRDPGIADRVRPPGRARPGSIREPAPSSAASATPRCRSRSAAWTRPRSTPGWRSNARPRRAALRERDRGPRRSRDRGRARRRRPPVVSTSSSG